MAWAFGNEDKSKVNFAPIRARYTVTEQVNGSGNFSPVLSETLSIKDRDKCMCMCYINPNTSSISAIVNSWQLDPVTEDDEIIGYKVRLSLHTNAGSSDIFFAHVDVIEFL